MIWLAFVSALALQTPDGRLDATPETYEPPAVRPFEPPSDFGREEAQGDAEGTIHRRPLTAPVTVGDYAGDYEASPSDAETAYDQGVAQAEIDFDGRMGPLDGRWRVEDAQGRPLLSLALTDRGGGRRVEGAWRRLDADAAVDGIGIAGPATAQGDSVTVPLGETELRLTPSAGGWTGVLVRNGRSRPVIVSRAG